MKKLYAPWRGSYTNKNTKGAPRLTKEDTCVLCSHGDAPPHDDAKNLVLKRLEHNYILLNAYPYNAGHVMIVPYTHTDTLESLTPKTRAEMMEAANKMITVMTHELKPDGFNCGINLGGKAAGGSIPEHVHMHVLPRWFGDTSFLPTLADTKPISQDLIKVYTRLSKALETK